MGKLLDCITPREEDFIASQKVFFVATAPLSAGHHINVSPKAPGTSLVVLGPHRVAYADLTGSGAEAAANVQENGRMMILFVHMEQGAPQILLLYGTARVVAAHRAEPTLTKKFPTHIVESHGFRSIFVLDVERVSTSCGYSMPVFQFERYRSTLDEWTAKKGGDGMAAYRLQKNSFSINGLDAHCTLGERGIPRNRIKPIRKNGYVLGEMDNSKQIDRMSTVASIFTNSQRSIALKAERFASMHWFLSGVTLFVLGIAIGKAL